MKIFNNRKVLVLSTLLFSLTACPALDKMDYPEPSQKEAFLAEQGLSYDYVLKEYKYKEAECGVRRIKYQFLSENKVIKTSEEMREFLDFYDSRKELTYEADNYNFLSNLDDKDFDDYNLLLSETIICNYEAFEHYFQSLFLKDNTLYIYLLYHDYLPPNTHVACVVGYEYLPIYISKSITFENIKFIIQNETSYRKK